jgi:hypothetical protein
MNAPVFLRMSTISFLGLCACARDRSPIGFTFPPGADQGTEVLIVTRSEGVQAFALPIDSTQHRLPIEIGSETVTLEALTYDLPLSDLKLQEGALSAFGDTSGRTPKTTFTTEIRDQKVDPWTPESSASSIAMKYAPRPSCISALTPVPPTFHGTEPYYIGAVADGPSSALLVARTSTGFAGHYYRADQTGIAPLRDLAPGYSPAAILRVPQGLTWMAAYGAQDGERAMLVGDIGAGFTATVSRPLVDSCVVLDMDYARTDTIAPPIYTLDSCDHIDRFARGVWTRLSTGADVFALNGQLAWVGRDELIHFSTDAMHLLHFKDGRDQMEPQDPPQDLLVSLKTVPKFGTFAGTASGFVFQRDMMMWQKFRGPFIGTIAATEFAAFDDNLLVAGNDGDIEAWSQGDFCSSNPTYVGINLVIRAVVPLDFGVVASGFEVLLDMGQQRRFFAAVLKRGP